MTICIVKTDIRETFAKLMEQEAVKRGLQFLEADQERCIAEQKVLVTVEAPLLPKKNGRNSMLSVYWN